LRAAALTLLGEQQKRSSMPNTSTLLWIGAGVTVTILSALFAWYFFLSGEEKGLDELARARGLDGATPTFLNPTGSTYANLTGGGISPVATESAAAARAKPPRLWRLSSVPASGVSIFDAATSTDPSLIQFVDRGTGNVFRANTQTGNIARLTNTLLPNIYEAVWVGPDKVLMRQLGEFDSIETFSAEIKAATSTNLSGEIITEQKLDGKYIERGIADIVSRPEETGTIAYLRSSQEGSALMQSLPDGSEAKRIWQSAIGGWELSWPEPNTAILTQRASANIPGSSYVISIQDASVSPFITGERGLAVAARDNETALFSTYTRGILSLNLRSADGNIFLPLRTFADKCVWDPVSTDTAYCAVPSSLPAANYPDSWYRGEVHFSDTWWKINTATLETELLLSPESEYQVILDVWDPIINPQATHIVFLDALTRTPWALSIRAD